MGARVGGVGVSLPRVSALGGQGSGVGQPVGPLPSWAGGLLGRSPGGGGGLFLFLFVFLFCIFFLLFIFSSVLIQFKILMHFIKLCLLHHNYLCNI